MTQNANISIFNLPKKLMKKQQKDSEKYAKKALG